MARMISWKPYASACRADPTAVVAAAAPIASAPAIPGSTARTSSSVDAEPGDLVRVVDRARAAARLGVLEQRVADRAADDLDRDVGRRRSTSGRCCRDRARGRDRLPRRRSASTRPPAGSSTARPIGCPASSSIATDDVPCVVQTLSQGTDRRLRAHRPSCSCELFAPRGILARNDPKVRRLEGLDEQVDVAVRRRARAASRCARARCGMHVDCGTARRPGCSSTSARTTRRRRGYARGRALDAFTYHGGFALQMAARCDVGARARLVGARRRRDARQRARATASRTSRSARPTSSTSCASSRSPASGSTRSCSIRRRSRRTRPSVERAVAGYKEINLRALQAARSRAATSSPAAARTTSTRRCSWTILEEAARRRPRDRGARREAACRRATIRCCWACPRRTT